VTVQDRRLERLLKLLATLLDTKRPLSRAAIAERIPLYPTEEAAIRQAFKRDIDALQKMGVPVEVDDGSPPTYRVRPEAYRLPDPGLDEEEQAALHLALATVGMELPEGSAQEALWKLTGGAAQTIEPPAATAELPGHEHLAAIWRATNERRRLRFTYNGNVREVDPWALSCRRGHWYLQGYDRRRGDDRRFRLDRIQGEPAVGAEAEAFERPSTRPPAGPPPPWLFGDEVMYTASVHVDAVQAELVRAMEGVTVAADRPDGSIVVSLPVSNAGGFRNFVFSLLDHATVLGPPEARDAVVAWLEAIADPGRGAS
jgi:proteasome accessory factor B